MKLVFATNNKNKLKEVRKAVGESIEILSLSDIGCNEEIPETQETIEGNARQKSEFIYNKYGYNCFSDDTGLEIDALNGEPGVYSARYAGPECSPQDNIEKVLGLMSNVTERSCRFRTVISLIIDGDETQFEGAVEGEILSQLKGEDGFGYDPIFRPAGFDLSFAEMPLVDKNKISHRGLATAKLLNYLLKLN